MEEWIARLQAILNRVPGPGKILFGSLTADRASFRSLAACLLAILGVSLSPPVISLGSPPIEQGLRTVGSGVPILVAANYLLLAILALVAGAVGDSIGRLRFLQIGLAAVLVAQLAGLFWLNTPGYPYAHLLLNMAQVTITPMCIALAAFTFTPGVRPFAFGLIFSTQAVALASSSTFYSLLKPVGNGTISFLLPVTLTVLALRLIPRYVTEPARNERVVWGELLANLLWAGAVFLAIYGLVARAGGLTSRNALLAITIGVGGLALSYRFFYRHLHRRGEIKLYAVRGLAFAILAAVTAAIVQALLFYQFWTYFADVRGLGPVATTLQFLPYLVGMLFGTTLIVRLSARFGARHLIAAGLLIAAGGLLALSLLTVETPLFWLALPLAVIGLGLGLAGPARTSVILSAPPPRLMGSGAGINTAAGQSGYALGVIVTSVLVTLLAEGVLHTQLQQSSLPPAVAAQIEGVWAGLFARVMSGAYGELSPEAVTWLQGHFGPAFTAGLSGTLLVVAALVAAIAVFIYVVMERGLKGSLIQPAPAANPAPDES